MHNVQNITLMLLILLLQIGCSAQKLGNSNDDSSQVEITTCYKNIHSFEGVTDIEIIIVKRTGDNLNGIYHWLPAFKDKRLGEFVGVTTSSNLADVMYSFEQEGVRNQTQLQLEFTQEFIFISGGEESTGLNRKLKKVKCD